MASPNTSPNEPDTIDTREAMRRLSYRSRQSFWVAVHSQGIPHIRINARRIIFPRDAFTAWLESRTVGKVATS